MLWETNYCQKVRKQLGDDQSISMYATIKIRKKHSWTSWTKSQYVLLHSPDRIHSAKVCNCARQNICAKHHLLQNVNRWWSYIFELTNDLHKCRSLFGHSQTKRRASARGCHAWFFTPIVSLSRRICLLSCPCGDQWRQLEKTSCQ